MAKAGLEKRHSPDKKMSRRRFLGILGGVGLGGVAASVAGYEILTKDKPMPGIHLPKPPKTETRQSGEQYPLHRTVATIFYVGEKASKDNGYIDNIATEWDTDSRRRFGGVDDPARRNSRGLPRDFQPRQNPFYFALPASEFTESGLIPDIYNKVPESWKTEIVKLGEDQSLFKGRWIKVTNQATGQEVYGQWLDTGPGENASSTQDYDYVFGTAEPAHPFGELGAALDVSPAMAHYLGFGMKEGGIEVTWQFVDEEDVPAMGPWNSKDFAPIDNYTHWE